MEKVLNIFKKIGNFLLDILFRIGSLFRDLGIGIWNGLKALGRSAKKFHKRFVESNIWTKLSHFVMGAGNFASKQFVKGALFLSLQVLFIVFMVASPKVNNTPLGYEAIPNFFTLGHDHGMPVSAEAKTIGENLVEVYISTNDDDTALKPSGMEINFKENSALVYQLVRYNNLYETVKNYDESAEYNGFAISSNSGEYKPYKTSVVDKIIYDNRYNTGDVYGYGVINAKEEFAVKGNSTTLLILSSPEKLETSNDIDGDNDFLDAFGVSTSNPVTIGVFYDSSEHAENPDVYNYYIFVSAIGYADSKVSISGSAFNDATITRFVTDKDLVTSTVDNSFLMMLFGLITFLFIALYLIAWSVNIGSSFKAQKEIEEGEKPSTFLEDLKSLLDSRFHMTLMTPALILIAIFTILPTILMIFIAFTDMDTSSVLSGSVLINWVGGQNFIDLFGGDAGNEIAKEIGQNFGRVLLWTFEWAIIATFTCYFGGIFLALLINRKDVKLKKVWRTIFILTIAIPQFITLLIMRNLLKDSGPINTMLQAIGLTDGPINFLQQGDGADASTKGIWLARGTVLVVNLYIGIPYTMLMTSGILMNIPADLYEAATIDGANKWQMFRKITLPYVIFVTTPYLIQSFIGNITSFNTIFLLTGGGPTVKGSGDIAGHTDLLVTWLYKMTIDNYKYNAGSIIGILTFLITASITLICYRNSKAYKEEDTFQ